MAGRILVWALLGVFAGSLVVPFVIGFVKGPDTSQPGPATDEYLGPLSRVAGVYGRFLALYAVIAAVSFAVGPARSVCAVTPYTASSLARGYTPLHGASVQATGSIQACVAHPSTGQAILYLLIRLPGPALLAGVLLMIWSLVRQARLGGPFTARTAAIMWRLGLLVLAGGAVAGAVSHLGADLLAETLLLHPGYIGGGIVLDTVVVGPLRELLPVPLLVGVALLSFARITRAGAAMDEEIRATV